jgi:hypothetical protein
MRLQGLEPGDEVTYDLTGLDQTTARARVVVEKFVGGGFAGQVYRVRLLSYEAGAVTGLVPGGVYAMKILIPPSSFSLMFRNALYFVGFQGAFQLQVNPAAARSGALWQKFIRRGAQIRFGSEQSVVDIHATFVDERLGSCGELSEWIDGRTWRLEVDDRLDLLSRWAAGKAADAPGSPEYRGKREFMRDFVALLHEVGAHEFARQYEWSTCKSQPNCLKRKAFDDDPNRGLVAVDFRAGLALLPFLPMSPGDFKLILQGLGRGSLVQFDRGDLDRLKAFVAAHPQEFAGMEGMLLELERVEAIYRASVPDVTHNHVRLLGPGLWRTIAAAAVRGWRLRGQVDETGQRKLEGSFLRRACFVALGIVPVLGRVVRKAWCHARWRSHYAALATRASYVAKALRGKAMESASAWHRGGRMDEAHARRVADSPVRWMPHVPLALLPAGLHRFLTDGAYAKACLSNVLVRPVRLYFDAKAREEWLLGMLEEGRRKHILDDRDAAIIGPQVHEPYIQKYLKCLVVHMCLMPVTHVVALAIAIAFVLQHPGMSRREAYAVALGIVAIFQVIPVSPGSLARGIYVLYLMIRERNFKDYNLAVFLSFFKYIGYLAFPIQMTYRYPALARFMAGHWATEAVHVVPVFGEGGALLERKVFDLFYNWPLTLRRRMNLRAQLRARHAPRHVHALAWVVVLAAAFTLLDAWFLHACGALPTSRQIWWATLLLPLCAGIGVTLGAGGAGLQRRIALAAGTGLLVGVLPGVVLACLAPEGLGAMMVHILWRTFLCTLVATVAAIVTEVGLPEPPVAA